MHSDNVADYGMIPVSKTAFFATVGKLDVHPSTGTEGYHQTIGYVSRWRTRAGELVGLSLGGTAFLEKRQGVTPEFYERNRQAILNADKG